MAIASLIPPNWSSFPEEFRSRLGTNVGRQRTMKADGDLLIVCHVAPEHDEAGRRGVLFWRDSQGEWRCSNGDPGKVAIGLHLDRYSKRIETCEQQEAAATRADDYLPLLEGLAPLVRSSRNLLDALEEARKALPEERSLIDHRDRAYDLARQAELLYEDAKNSMDVAVIRRADEQTNATHQMTVAAPPIEYVGGNVLSLRHPWGNLWNDAYGQLELVSDRRPLRFVSHNRTCDRSWVGAVHCKANATRLAIGGLTPLICDLYKCISFNSQPKAYCRRSKVRLRLTVKRLNQQALMLRLPTSNLTKTASMPAVLL